jgi:hypothetical protein
MPLYRTRFCARIGGIPRILFSIIEKQNGELILIPKTADRMETGDGPRILQQRYSIHPSPNSSDFSTIKQTINAEDGQSITSVVLTDAIKRKTGFSILLVRRVQNLTPDKYILEKSAKKYERAFVLADYDPELYTMFFGVFIGHNDTPFDVRPQDIVVSHFPFARFKIILFTSLAPMPSHWTTSYAHAVTLPPEKPPTGMTADTLRYHMTGKSPEICIEQYRNSVKTLVRGFWLTVLPELTRPELIQYAHEQIAQVSDVNLVALEPGTNPLSIHMLTSGTPPKSQ